jgi:hypothetical protein
LDFISAADQNLEDAKHELKKIETLNLAPAEDQHKQLSDDIDDIFTKIYGKPEDEGRKSFKKSYEDQGRKGSRKAIRGLKTKVERVREKL